MGSRTVMLTIKVTPEERERLRAVAKANDDTMSQMLRRWVREVCREHAGAHGDEASAPKT